MIRVVEDACVDNYERGVEDAHVVATESTPPPEMSEKEVSERDTLEKILQRDKTHKQWFKHGVCTILIILLLLASLFRGTKQVPSVVGIKTCSAWDWIVLGAFILISGLVTLVSIIKARREQALKIKYNRGIVDSDLRLQGRTLAKLLMFGLVGGWVSGALGLGGGSIFNPVLLSMGVPPTVSSSTGMYMIIFSTIGSSAIYLIFGLLNIEFALWIGFWTTLGSMMGLFLLNKITSKFNRQSPIVIVLSLVLGFSAVLIPIFGALDLKKEADLGKDIFAFRSFCG
jgi:uncharacterized membrane protein YfcA